MVKNKSKSSNYNNAIKAQNKQRKLAKDLKFKTDTCNKKKIRLSKKLNLDINNSYDIKTLRRMYCLKNQ